MINVITNAGTLDKTEVYLFDGHNIIETRNGSNNMVQQIVNGTQYIDEHVMMRVADKGDLYIHQDANWNVIGATDLGGSLVERYEYTPYGQLVANQETGYGDRDGDGDVDGDDKGTPGTTCTGTVTGACRILDLDFDGDYDATDAGLFDSLPQGNAGHPGQHMTGLDQQFGHQGLVFEPEIAQYHNRARQYDPQKRTFVQRDEIVGASVTRPYRDGLHLYAYVQLRPIRLLDPTGEYAYLICTGYHGQGQWDVDTTCCYASDSCSEGLCQSDPEGCDTSDHQPCGDGHVACPPFTENWDDNPTPSPSDSWCFGACLGHVCNLDFHAGCGQYHGCCEAYCDDS